MRAGVIAGNDPLELVATLSAQRKHEQLLGNRIGVGWHDIRLRLTVVELLVDTAHIIGDGSYLAHIRKLHQLLLEPIDPVKDVRPLHGIRWTFQHDLKAVNAGQLLIDHRAPTC